ncbi:hypothetical protein CIC12_24455 [Burkholderia sp. SG-MS1]|nr:hypothetical protein [Paraburkholderia sp. SG-MS1]
MKPADAGLTWSAKDKPLRQQFFTACQTEPAAQADVNPQRDEVGLHRATERPAALRGKMGGVQRCAGDRRPTDVAPLASHFSIA